MELYRTTPHPRCRMVNGAPNYVHEDGRLEPVGFTGPVGGRFMNAVCARHTVGHAKGQRCSVFLDYVQMGVANCDLALNRWLCAATDNDWGKAEHQVEAARLRAYMKPAPPPT